jgi:anti-sigma regulatory factor (Ser/Thr protein kinase)
MKAPRSGGELSLLLKLGLLIGCSALVIAVFVFTQQTIHSLSREIATTSQVLARFCAQASYPATLDPQLEDIVQDLISHIDFPMVITDSEGMPRAWRQVDVDEASVPNESIDSLKLGFPISPVIHDRIDQVRRRVAELDRRNAPIPMTMPGVGARLGDVHFGAPPVLERLRWMPYVSMAGVLALLAIGLWGLAILRQAEKRTIWVGMAKETAHQLGTPLSSLMGWTELLRDRRAEADGHVRIPAAELDEALGEMERDIERLSKVAQRFSRVGSAPELEARDVTPIVGGVVAYMRKRIPQASGEVEIRERYAPAPPARVSAELLEWALENLIVNALNALDKRPAWVEVSVAPRDEGRAVEIRVADNGRGMIPADRRRAFEPGFTTKRRGWGLGLPLARRVVVEYHGGKIAIAQSAPGKGTVMAVTLPAEGATKG